MAPISQSTQAQHILHQIIWGQMREYIYITIGSLIYAPHRGAATWRRKSTVAADYRRWSRYA